MELVLNEGVESACGLAVLVVVVAALLENIRNFLIGPALTGSNLPDTLQQFIEVVPSEGPAVLHQLVVEHKALGDVLFQCFSGPLAEAGGLLGIDPVAYGDDGVQIVKVYHTPDAAPAFILNCFYFGNSCGPVKFFLFIDILQMLTDGRRFDIEQFRHCFLRQPEGFISKHNADKFLLSAVVVEQNFSALNQFFSHTVPSYYQLKSHFSLHISDNIVSQLFRKINRKLGGSITPAFAFPILHPPSGEREPFFGTLPALQGVSDYNGVAHWFLPTNLDLQTDILPQNTFLPYIVGRGYIAVLLMLDPFYHGLSAKPPRSSCHLWHWSPTDYHISFPKFIWNYFSLFSCALFI